MVATEPIPERLFECPHYSRHGFDYWQQREDGRILAGGFRDTALATEFTTSEETTPEIQSALESFVSDLVGWPVVVTHRWAGLFGFVPDLMPVVGSRARRGAGSGSQAATPGTAWCSGSCAASSSRTRSSAARRPTSTCSTRPASSDGRGRGTARRGAGIAAQLAPSRTGRCRRRRDGAPRIDAVAPPGRARNRRLPRARHEAPAAMPTRGSAPAGCGRLRICSGGGAARGARTAAASSSGSTSAASRRRPSCSPTGGGPGRATRSSHRTPPSRRSARSGERALDRIAELGLATVEIPARDDDPRCGRRWLHPGSRRRAMRQPRRGSRRRDARRSLRSRPATGSCREPGPPICRIT